MYLIYEERVERYPVKDERDCDDDDDVKMMNIGSRLI